MSDPKTLVRNFFAAISDGTAVDRLDEFIAPDIVNHGFPAGVEGVRDALRGYNSALTDMRIEILDMVAEGDKVALRSRLSGTHSGPIFGLAPTGRHVRLDVMEFVRIAGDKIVERWGVAQIVTL